jgi:predicted phage-related endonuclease
MAIEHHTPENREQWRALRAQDITASEIAGLLPGVHPYRTPYSLHAVKSGRLAPEDLDTTAMARGRALEPVAVQFVAEQMPGATIAHNIRLEYWREPEARIGATPDLLVTRDGELGVVQIKSIEPSIYARNWPEHEPPLWVALQALTEAKLIGATWAAVAALRVGYAVNFNLTPIPLHDGAWARLVAEAAAFWRGIELGTPPDPDFGRDAATIARLNETTSGTAIDLTHDREFCAAIAERERLKAAARDFDRRCAELEGLIRHRAGDAALILAGNYRVTLRPEHRAGYTVPPSSRRPIRVKRIAEGA